MVRTVKLIAALVSVAVIPLIILCIVGYNIISPIYEDSYFSGMEKLIYVQAQDINGIYEESISLGKEITSSNSLKAFFKNENTVSKGEFERNARHVILNNTYIKGIIITDTSYNVKAYSLKYKSDFEVPDSLADYDITENGVSPFFAYNADGDRRIYFFIARDVYDLNNEIIGKAIFLCDSGHAEQTAYNARQYKTINIMLADSYGNVIYNPYNYVYSLEDVYKSEDAHIYMSNAISGYEGINASFSGSFYENGKEYLAASAYIPSAGWTLIATIERSEVAGAMSGFVSGMLLAVFLLTVVAVTFSILFASRYLRPELETIDTIRKNTGNRNMRVIADSPDEFADVQMYINSLLSSINETEMRYHTLVDITDNIVFEINIVDNYVYMSNRFTSKYSFRARSDRIVDSFFKNAKVHKDDRDRFAADMAQMLSASAKEDSFQGEYRIKNIYGDFAWALIRGNRIRDDDGNILRFIGAILDIDREKRSELSLLQKATYDNLTQLFNRQSFIAACQHEFSLAGVKNSMCAVIFVDLDDFKGVNDTYGHASGDEVLKFTADTIKQSVSERGFAGRLGGDEFVIFMRDITHFSDPGELAKDVIATLAEGFDDDISEHHFSVNCSMGIAFYPDNGNNCEQIIQAADDAMYTVKKHGKSNYAYAKN